MAYGSLVPLDYHAVPVGQAWATFVNAPFLQLGVESRADWVANGVLYLPVGFLFARAVMALPAVLAWLVAFACSAAFATGIEFAQLFFPPRTVSQNDLMAEFIGSGLGAALALSSRPWVGRWHAAWGRGGKRLVPHLFEAYAAIYLTLSFFPYDLLLSLDEVQQKFGSPNLAWSVALPERGWAVALLQLVVEAALVLPLGVMLSRRLGTGPVRTALFGLALGSVVEVGQVFIASGVSQGASLFSRAAGMAVGAGLAPWLLVHGTAGVAVALRQRVWPALVIYVPILLFVNGWFRGSWQGLAAAGESWAATRLMPFYYHYFTTEAQALYSLGSVSMMYLPLAALGWARQLPAAAVVLAVGGLATAVEASKLFIAGQHPDPTNPLIAMAAVAAAWRMAAVVNRTAPAITSASAVAPRRDALPSPRRAGLYALPVVGAVLALAWATPAWSGALTAGLALAMAAVWWRPAWALMIVPAAMPLLDLAPWTGRFYWTEFDLLLAGCLAVAWARTPARPTGSRRWTALSLAFGLLAVSLAISAVHGLRVWQWPGADAFNSYYSTYNGLRILKGAAWAWLFVQLLRRVDAQGQSQMFGAGMVVGLAGTVACVLWERVVFVGLIDFSTDYRVTGPFSAMHKGGAYVECYLAVGSAFALAWALTAQRVPARALGLAVVVGAVYALSVTYSRNGYAALSVVLLLSLAQAWGGRASPVRRVHDAVEGRTAGPGAKKGATAAWRWAGPTLALMVVAAAAIPVLGGPYARDRLAQSAHDLGVRQAHWADAVQMRQDGVWAALFGEGLGRFPEAHFWRSREAVHAGTYRVVREGDNQMLRLGSGATLYIEQILPRTAADAPLVLRADVRSAAGPVIPAVSLCEKWLLTSLRCAEFSTPTRVDAPKSLPGWQRLEWQVDPRALTVAASAAAALRPLKLSLHTPVAGASFDIDHISLTHTSGIELVANGDFAAGMDRWFFATDVDPPWHIHSLPVGVWFEQGALGVLAWGSVVLLAVGLGIRQRLQGRAAVPAALVAVAGFITSGMLNTLIDDPRFLWLLLVFLWLAAAARPLGPSTAP